MTIATYTSNLVDIFLFEVTTGVSAYGGGGAGLTAAPDFAMEGVNAVDKQVTNADKGLMFDNVSNFSIGPRDHFYVWIIGGTPGLNDTRDNHGIQSEFTHPKDATYLFGPDEVPMPKAFLDGRQPDHLVYVPTDTHRDMFSFVTFAVVAWDRRMKQ